MHWSWKWLALAMGPVLVLVMSVVVVHKDRKSPAQASMASSKLARTPSAFHPRGRSVVAAPSRLAASVALPSYSMAAYQYLPDPAAARAQSIAVGDISGDGRDDLVFQSMHYAPNPSDSRLEIYAAYQRNGQLDAAVKIGELTNSFGSSLRIADLDRDGVGDVITANLTSVVVLSSNENGTFTPSTTVVTDPFELVATDVDRDGYLDVLVDSSDTSATVVHGHARGDMDRTSMLPLPSSAVRTVGDVTGDGLDDLILATIVDRPLQEFRVYRALASGGYAAPVVLYRPMGDNQTGSLAVGDFNADGRGDLALDEVMDYSSVHMYFQDALGNLVSSPDIARQRGSGSLVATDLDRDGRTDLAIAHTGWGYIGYYLQSGAGLTPETVIDPHQYMGRSNYFAAGDLNDDGCGDLVISRWSQSPILLYGQGCARPKGVRTGGNSPAQRL